MFLKRLNIFYGKLATLNLKYYSASTNLVIYNSLSKKKEKLKLENKNVLYWYNCGPTVYDSAHIGHAR